MLGKRAKRGFGVGVIRRWAVLRKPQRTAYRGTVPRLSFG